VTTRTYNHFPFFKDERSCDVLMQVITNFYKEERFFLYAYVFMPDHLHLLVKPRRRIETIRRTQETIRRTQEIVLCAQKKKSIQKKVHAPVEEHSQMKDREDSSRVSRVVTNPASENYTISEIMHSIKRSSSRLINKQYPNIHFRWCEDFYDFNVYSSNKFEEKLNYIHQNPVRAKLVNDLADYKYSSARNYYFGDRSAIRIDQPPL